MMNISTREIVAAAFKATCLQLIDEVAERREEIVITKRGKPLAKLVPVVEEPPELVSWLRGTVSISGDIVASSDDRWDADQEPDGGPDA